MKRVYWRPRTVSQTVVVLIAVSPLAGLLAVEHFKSDVKQEFYEEKFRAVELAQKCFDAIKLERIGLKHPIDTELDPAETGMIGELMTPTTTIAGHLGSKQTSTNPNFAAVVVDMLKRANVREGDLVAVGYSGSFPALNTSVCAALQTLKAKPIVIASAGASQFGANFPDLLWIDMEDSLNDHELISFRSVACSIGGYEDLGLGMSDEAKTMVTDAIKRNNLQLLQASSFTAGIDERMQVYADHAKGNRYKAYINVGGGTISVGRTLGKKMYSPGLNLNPSQRATQIDSVMSRFARQSVPVIHLVQVEELAVKYGLTIQPTSPVPAGEGAVFVKTQHNRWLAAGVLVLILISLRALLLTDLGFRLFAGGRAKKAGGEPEPMV